MIAHYYETSVPDVFVSSSIVFVLEIGIASLRESPVPA